MDLTNYFDFGTLDVYKVDGGNLTDFELCIGKGGGYYRQIIDNVTYVAVDKGTNITATGFLKIEG